MNDAFCDFEEFWPYYLGEHSLASTRQLHFVGTTVGLTLLSVGHWAEAPLIAYGCAWIGHFFFEKNKPATFRHPLWSLRGDFRMYRLMLLGELDAEVARLRDPSASRAAERA